MLGRRTTVKVALAIALGGALGSVGRYYVMGAAERWLASLIGTASLTAR